MHIEAKNVVDLSHRIIKGKENFTYDCVTKFATAEHDPSVWYVSSRIYMSSHVGTHVEFPFHHRKDGYDCESYPLERLIGRATVINVVGKKAGEAITLEDVRKYKDVLHEGDMVFFRTDFDLKYRTPDWEPYPYLSEDALNWLIEQYHPLVVGTDATQFEIPGTTCQPIHTTLFQNNIPIVESLTNLQAIEGKEAIVIIPALPMRAVDASPCRILGILDC